MSNATRTIGQDNAAFNHARDVLAGIGVKVQADTTLADISPRLVNADAALVDMLGQDPTVYLRLGLDTTTAALVLDLALSPAVDPAGNPWVGGSEGARYLPL